MLRGLVLTPFAFVLGLLLSLDDARASADVRTACPADCDSCDDGTCHIACAPGSWCAQQTVTCPAGMDCAVECHGDASCRASTIVGPTGHELTVACDGAGSCGGAVLDSGRDLALVCNGDDACAKATLYCSSGACDWSCMSRGSCEDIAVE